MTCRSVRLPDGTVALVRMASPRPRVCKVCGRKTPDYVLCDFPTGPGKTCDVPLCKACARHTDPNTDHCPLHALAIAGKLKL